MSRLPITLAFVLSAAVDGGVPPKPTPSLLAPSRGASSAVDRPYELRRAKDGTGDLVFDGPGFTARIARDGGVRIDDKHFSLIRSWSLLPFAPLPMPRGTPTLQGALENMLTHRDPRPRARDGAPVDPSLAPTPLVPRMSPYRPDPSEACQYPRDCYFDAGVVLIGVGGTFDLTDELMRLSGQDPYRHEKALFLAATRDLRGALGARALAAGVRREAAALAARLETIACDSRRSVAERRAAVEALRREMDGETDAARDAVEIITRFLATRFDGADGGVRCP